MLIRGEIVEQMVDDSTILADIRICNFKHSFFNREITIPRLENDFDENNIAQKEYKQHNNIWEDIRKSSLDPGNKDGSKSWKFDKYFKQKK